MRISVGILKTMMRLSSHDQIAMGQASLYIPCMLRKTNIVHTQLLFLSFFIKYHYQVSTLFSSLGMITINNQILNTISSLVCLQRWNLNICLAYCLNLLPISSLMSLANKCFNSQGYMLRNQIYKFILKIVYLILWSL